MVQRREVEGGWTTERGKASGTGSARNHPCASTGEQRFQAGIERRRLERIEAQCTVRINHMVGDVATHNRSLGLFNGLLVSIIEFRFAVTRTGQRIHRPTVRVSRLAPLAPSNCRLIPAAVVDLAGVSIVRDGSTLINDINWEVASPTDGS